MPKMDSITYITDTLVTCSTASKDSSVFHIINENRNMVDAPVPNQYIPVGVFIGLALTAVAIYFVFKFISRFVLPYLKSKKGFTQVDIGFYRLKTFIWILFLFFVIYHLLSANWIIGVSMLVFATFFGAFLWKDILLGIVFKMENNYQVNDQITVKNLSGKIIELKGRGIDVLTENEEYIFIPYHLIQSDSIAKKPSKGELRRRKITIHVPIESKHNSLKGMELLLQNCPWVYAHNPNSVEQLDETSYEFIVYVYDNVAYKRIEDYLYQQLKQF